MPALALVTGFVTVVGGLVLLAIWLIEYDPEYQAGATTRLPIPVISAHVLLAVTGLAVWVVYLVTDRHRLAWAAVVILTAVVVLGFTMAWRWIGVRRMPMTVASTWPDADGSQELAFRAAVPPERHFPVPVVVGHGLFAMTTFVLVVLTALGVGAS
jgi:lysylphosphatidylglycerol synthetase-like protein (DUF2156 family)